MSDNEEPQNSEPKVEDANTPINIKVSWNREKKHAIVANHSDTLFFTCFFLFNLKMSAGCFFDGRRSVFQDQEEYETYQATRSLCE